MKRVTASLILGMSLLNVLESRVRAADNDQEALQQCLTHWEGHPFKTEGLLKYRKLSTSVKVLGIGPETTDAKVTSQPELVLINPSVNVLTKNTYRLMNPNGYYCFKANVTVLAKAEIVAHCKAHVATKSDGVAVLAKNQDTQAITVLGKTVVKKTDCM